MPCVAVKWAPGDIYTFLRANTHMLASFAEMCAHTHTHTYIFGGILWRGVLFVEQLIFLGIDGKHLSLASRNCCSELIGVSMHILSSNLCFYCEQNFDSVIFSELFPSKKYSKKVVTIYRIKYK